MDILLTQNKKEEIFLRKKVPAVDFKKETRKSLRELVRAMRQVMKKANGIGLSANQVGIAKRLFVAEVPDDGGRMQFYSFFNPEIVKTSGEKKVLEEGCLSVPGEYGLVERSYRVMLEGYTIEGKKVKVRAWGLLAHVFQHEVDHLNGKLFIDKAKKRFKAEAKI